MAWKKPEFVTADGVQGPRVEGICGTIFSSLYDWLTAINRHQPNNESLDFGRLKRKWRDMLQVMLVANHRTDTEHLHSKLMLEEGISVVADVVDFDQAVRAACTHKVDLVLVALSRLWYQDVELIRDLKTIRPSMKFLVVSTERQASAALRALHAGVDGFVVRDEPIEELVAAMRVLASGRRYVCPSVAHQIALNVLVSRSAPRRRLAF